MAQTPSIPKGTRDFGPEQMARRNYIFDTIRGVFRKFGYSQIETPAQENLSTLLGKYGDEGDKLLFRILNSGDAFAGIDLAALADKNSGKKPDLATLDSKALAMKICEKGLRYDLTVPFARFVVQHQNELSFPFKRFQIQPVWRADRPQKGRYREFYQCDADSIGSKSLLGELEMIQMVDEVFRTLGIRVCLKINNRKVLAGLSEVCGCPDRMTDITVAIDKIEKIGLEAVVAELKERELTDDAIEILKPVLTLQGTTAEKLSSMRKILEESETGKKGLDEIEELFGLIKDAGVECDTELDLSLARGLNYYTGAIFEVKALDFEIGSICGGGRYDNLTGIFGLPNMSGVGISFGADRIYDVLAGLDKYPESLTESSRILFANMGDEEVRYVLPLSVRLRKAGIACEIYPDNSKLKKQFDYADRKGIHFLSICGADEVATKRINVKNLASGEQKSFDCDSLDDILSFIA